MKSEIIQLLHEVATEEGGVFTTLFGSEETDIHQTLNINWIFSKTEMKESLSIVLEHIISQVLQSYNVGKYIESSDEDHYKSDGKHKVIIFDNNKTVNRLLPINYEVIDGDVKFADLENYMEDIDVTDNGQHIYFKWAFPIYKIKQDTLNTF